MSYWLHPEAHEDLREAAEFYREQAGAALSQSFIGEFEYTVGLLLQHPRLGSLWRYGKRRLVTRRFPFSVIYKVVGEQIRILAVAHHSRRPGHWRRLMGQVPNHAFERTAHQRRFAGWWVPSSLCSSAAPQRERWA